MEILKCDKIDCGSYTVLARNEKGETISQAVEFTEQILITEVRKYSVPEF